MITSALRGSASSNEATDVRKLIDVEFYAIGLLVSLAGAARLDLVSLVPVQALRAAVMALVGLAVMMPISIVVALAVVAVSAMADRGGDSRAWLATWTVLRASVSASVITRLLRSLRTGRAN